MGSGERAAIEARLVAAGADPAEVAACADLQALKDLSGEVALRPAGAPRTLEALAVEAGVELDEVRHVLAVAGLRTGGADEARWFASDVSWLRDVQAARELFGDVATDALVRRAGAVTAQLAHAAGAAFRVNVLGQEDADGNPALAQVERNLGARALVDVYLGAVAQLFLHHLRSTIREDSVAAGAYGELRTMCVGFVDLAQSTELGERITAHELASLIADFDTAAFTAATEAGARVVKTIGDEVMICADRPEPVAEAAHRLVAYCRAHHTLSGARAALAYGEVLDQDGDCYGPVVNRAARLVEAAADGTVVADAAATVLLRDTARIEHLPDVVVRGIGRVSWACVVGLGDPSADEPTGDGESM